MKRLIFRAGMALLRDAEQPQGERVPVGWRVKAKARRIAVLTTFLLLASTTVLPIAGQEHHTVKGLSLAVTALEVHPSWKPPSVSGVVVAGKRVSEIAVVHLGITKWVGGELTKQSLVSFELTLLDGTKVPCALGGWTSQYEIGPDGTRKPLPAPKPAEVPLGFVFGAKCVGADKCSELEIPFAVPKGTTRFASIRVGGVSFDLKDFDGAGQASAAAKPWSGASIATPLSTFSIVGVELAEKFPPGCDEGNPLCYMAQPGYQILVIWLKTSGDSSEASHELMKLSAGVRVKSDDGVETKIFSGGKWNSKLFVAFTPPQSGKNFVLYWEGNPPISLGKLERGNGQIR